MYKNLSFSFNLLMPAELAGSMWFTHYVEYIEGRGIKILNKEQECSCKWGVSGLQVSEFVYASEIYMKYIYNGGSGYSERGGVLIVDESSLETPSIDN